MRSLLLLALGTAACSSGSSDSPIADAGPADAAMSPFAIPCTDSLASISTAPAGLPPHNPSLRGEILRCAFDRHLSAADVSQLATKLSFASTKVDAGVTFYRFSYRTERLAGKGAIGTGWAMMPDKAIAGMPLIASAHGTTGVGAKCAASKQTLEEDDTALALFIAASGYVVVQPDYAGAEFDQVVPAYLSSEDEAHSILDGTRAMRKLLRAGSATDDVLLIGHSQGGHAALSTQALAGSYGAGGKLAGVVALAAPWWTAKTYAAAMTPLGALDTKTHAYAIAYATLYLWSHGELYEGAGAGGAIFKPEKRAAIDALYKNTCVSDFDDAIVTLGNTAADFYEQAFIDDVGMCAAVDSGCDNALAMKWQPRFRADRPKLDGAGAPVTLWQGALDRDVAADRAMCGVDKIKADLAGGTASFTVCGDAQANHGGIVKRNVPWILSWIAARAKGAASPSCPGVEALGGVTCAMPPSNTD